MKRGRPVTGYRKRRATVSLGSAAWFAARNLADREGMSISAAVDYIMVDWEVNRIASTPVPDPDPAAAPVEMSPDDLEAFRMVQAAAIKAGLPGINTGSPVKPVSPVKHENIEWEDDDDAS